MKPTTMLKLSKRRNHPSLSSALTARRLTYRRSPDPDPVTEAPDRGPSRPSLDDFVGQAAAEADSRGASVLELGSLARRYSDKFESDRYHSLGFPSLARPRGPWFVFGPLPVADEGFGLVLCTDLVGRSPEPQGILTELNRALEPDGRLFLAAPLIIPDSSEGYLPWRTRFGLNYLLEASGFAIEDLQALERTRSYGVVARKTRRPGHSPVGPTGRDGPRPKPVTGQSPTPPAGASHHRAPAPYR